MVGAPGGFEIRHGFQQPQVVLLILHQDKTKQGQRCNHATWSSVDPWPFSCRGSRQDLPLLSVLGRSGHRNEPPQLRSLYSEEKCIDIWVLRITYLRTRTILSVQWSFLHPCSSGSSSIRCDLLVFNVFLSLVGFSRCMLLTSTW